MFRSSITQASGLHFLIQRTSRLAVFCIVQCFISNAICSSLVSFFIFFPWHRFFLPSIPSISSVARFFLLQIDLASCGVFSIMVDGCSFVFESENRLVRFASSKQGLIGLSSFGIRIFLILATCDPVALLQEKNISKVSRYSNRWVLTHFSLGCFWHLISTILQRFIQCTSNMIF